MGRFVRPATCILKLANGDTLTVKKRLTAGEQRAAFARSYLPASDGTLKVNPLEIGLSIVTTYLVDWSFEDDHGDPVLIRGLSVDELSAILDSLSPDAFAEVREAIETHAAAMQAERTAEKNVTAGETGSDPISPSPSAPAGRSMTSDTWMPMTTRS